MRIGSVLTVNGMTVTGMADIKDIIDNAERCLCHIQDACMLCPYIEGDATEDCMENLMRDALEAMKSQQAEIERLQPKKGHWEMKEDPFGLFDEIPVCSECGCTNDMRKKTEFCEHCGADMRDGDGE